MTERDLEIIVKGLAPVLRERFAAIEKRVTELEARPAVTYRGIHSAGAVYSEGHLVTRSGALWIALSTTTTTPGATGSDWKLVVKSGGAV